LFADQPSLLAGKMLLALILYPLGRSIGDLAIIVISVGVYLLSGGPLPWAPGPKSHSRIR
jgi:hypothetical protein